MEANQPTALIVDDEISICTSLAGVLSDEGWQTQIANSGREALRKFVKDPPDLVLLDVWMEGWDGIETLQRLKEVHRDVPIVIMSGHGTIETAVRAVKLGAFDYLEKPLSLTKILPMLEHALLYKSNRQVDLHRNAELVGRSEAMEKVRDLIRLVAPKNASVLITGENGTGKEVVAQLIHENSPRAKGPFVAINCAAIPEELIESELFGHEKGSFTNAVQRKKGKFELADKGTLFLDEIGDMSLRTQAKILRILQDQKFERVGGGETLRVDVRIVAATNKRLEEAIKIGDFREDLYYRLNVVPFQILPLRDRGQDIIELADHFLKVFASGVKIPRLSEDAKAAMLKYHWPGNVRELRNSIERACIVCQGEMIQGNDLPASILRNNHAEKVESTFDVAAHTLREARHEFEKSFIISKLEEFEWNVTRTAEAIGIERSNLHRKIKAYGIDSRQLRE